MKRFLFTLSWLAFSLVSPARAAPPAFTSYGDAKMLFSSGVKVTAGQAFYFTSGAGAGANAPDTMKGQALVALKRLGENIAPAGFTLKDVVYLRACLFAGADGKVDYAGWNEAWAEMFGTAENPNKPARTTIEIPAFGPPGRLLSEMECVCVAPVDAAMSAGSEKLGLPVSNPMLKPYGRKEGRFYSAMGVVPSAALYWTAGVGAPVLLPDAPATSPEKYGDIQTQTRGVLKKLKEILASVGLTFQDVVYLHAFVGPDKFRDGSYPIAGWNTTYDEFFNNAENPHKPARATVTTPTFSNPGAMLEVEISAAFPGKPGAMVTFDSAASTNPNLKEFGAPTAMIASGVAVKAGSSLFFSAGTAPKVVDGDMKTQALSALEILKSRLAEAGLGFKDVIFMRAYVVPEADGVVDRKGWTEAYGTFFNNPANPHKPARTTIAVKSMPRAGVKIEIDVIAAAP